MSAILIKALQLVLSLSLLVFVHELGHFLFARLFKTRVEKFYLFFNPWFSLWKKKIGETTYGIGWLPLGGYVSISGMIDESMNKDAMKEEPKPYEFRSKKRYQRLLIMAGGVLFNFILAMVIYIGVLNVWGTSYISTNSLKYGISVSEGAREIGLETGDKIISIDGTYIDDFNRIIPTIAMDEAKNITILRQGDTINVPVTNEKIAKIVQGQTFIAPRYLHKFKIGKVVEGTPADNAGLKKGDAIVGYSEVNNTSGKVSAFMFYDQAQAYFKENAGQEIFVLVSRNNEQVGLPVKISDEGTIGFMPQFLPEATNYVKYKTQEYNFFEAIPAGIKMGVNVTASYIKQLKLMFSPETKAYESLGGFITIANIFPSEWNWKAFWTMSAFLSIILGVMNLLPIPALDGGHILFLLYEIITGRKPSTRFLEVAQTIGMLVLLALVLFANGNDIFKLFK